MAFFGAREPRRAAGAARPIPRGGAIARGKVEDDGRPNSRLSKTQHQGVEEKLRIVAKDAEVV